GFTEDSGSGGEAEGGHGHLLAGVGEIHCTAQKGGAASAGGIWWRKTCDRRQAQTYPFSSRGRGPGERGSPQKQNPRLSRTGGLLTTWCLHLAGQLRPDLEQVAYQAVVGYLEDRCFLVRVDRDDHLGVLHARQVLDGTGDAHGDVQLRRN